MMKVLWCLLILSGIIFAEDMDTVFLEVEEYPETESLVTAVLNYTNEHPWLWAVYVVVIGLPLVVIVFFCCSGSSQEKDEMARNAEAKKTDAHQPDDDIEAEEDEVKESGSYEDEKEEQESDQESVSAGVGAPSSP